MQICDKYPFDRENNAMNPEKITVILDTKETFFS